MIFCSFPHYRLKWCLENSAANGCHHAWTIPQKCAHLFTNSVSWTFWQRSLPANLTLKWWIAVAHSQFHTQSFVYLIMYPSQLISSRTALLPIKLPPYPLDISLSLPVLRLLDSVYHHDHCIHQIQSSLYNIHYLKTSTLTHRTTLIIRRSLSSIHVTGSGTHWFY